MRKIIIDKKRKIFTDNKKDIDVSFIEIKSNDNINNFLEIDEEIINAEKNIRETKYKKHSFYLIHYPKNEDVEVSYGQIININENNIKHLCCTENGSSGAPILSLKSFKVIGIHYGGINNKYNLGTLIKYPIDKINLINSVINFYQECGKEYMNFSEKYQIMNLINSLNPNASLLKTKKQIYDPLHYINEEKIIINFINRNNELFKVKLPKSITKSDLYSISFKYRSDINPSYKILLIYNNSILESDNSDLSNISNNDNIIIIEDKYYIDDSYYKELNSRVNIYNWKEAFIYGDTRERLLFPDDISFSEMLKAIYFKYGIDEKSIFNYFNPNQILKSYNTTIRIELSSCVYGGNIYNYGKKIKVDAKGDGIHTSIIIGILDSNKELIRRINSLICDERKKIKNCYIDKKDLNIKEEKSLLSLGIKSDFSCTIIFE